MPDSTAARLVSLNQQAIAVLRLGIPLDFGLGSDPVERLREINERLIVEPDNDEPAESLLAKHDFPVRYVSIARMLLETDDPALIFDSIAGTEMDREAASIPFRQALAEPIVVAVLVYVCMIFLCSFTVPHLEDQYVQDGQSPSGVTQLLIWVRDAMPYWLVGFPIAAIAFIFLWRRFAKTVLLNLAPGGRRYGRWLIAESQSQQLAAMTESNVEQNTAIELAGQSVSPPTPARPIAEGIMRTGSPESSGPALMRLSRFYRFLADDRRRSLFGKVPAFMSLGLAAVIVFAYALATFLPWVEVLSNLSGLGEVGQ